MPEFNYTMCLQVPTARRGHWTPRARVRDGCEHPVWVLGTEPRTSARALSAFSCWAIFQFLLICWDGLSLNLDLASFCRLATQFGFGFPCLCALSAVITDDFHALPTLIWVLGSELQSSLLYDKCFYPLNYLPNLVSTLCLCVLHADVRVSVVVQRHGGQRSASSLFLRYSLSTFLRQCFLQKLIGSARLAGQQAPGIFQSLFLVLGSQMNATVSSFLYGCQGSKFRSSCLHNQHFTDRGTSQPVIVCLVQPDV